MWGGRLLHVIRGDDEIRNVFMMRVTVKSIVNVDVHVDQWSCVRMQKASVIRRAAAEISLIGREAVLWHRLRVQVLDGWGRLPQFDFACNACPTVVT